MKITITLLLQKTFAKTINIPIASLDKKWKQIQHFYSIKNVRGKTKASIGSFQQAEAACPVEVGDWVHAGQAGQRDAVQMVAAARCPSPSQSPTVCVPWRTV